MLTANQFAQKTAVHADHASKLCRTKKLKGARKVDGEWQIPVLAFKAFIKARRARKAARR